MPVLLIGGTGSPSSGREVRTLNSSVGRKTIAEGKICCMVGRNRGLIELIVFLFATLYCDQLKGQGRVGHVACAGVIIIIIIILH